MRHRKILKICTQDEWDAAKTAGVYAGSVHDVRDGFIHFSTAEQVVETAAKHFAGQSDLVIVAVSDEQFGDALKWEVSRGGAEFPHLYGQLDPSLAEAVDDLPLGKDGRHVFPDWVFA